MCNRRPVASIEVGPDPTRSHWIVAGPAGSGTITPYRSFHGPWVARGPGGEISTDDFAVAVNWASGATR